MTVATDLFHWPVPSSAGVPGQTGQRIFGVYGLSILAAQAGALPFLGVGVTPVDESGVTYLWNGSAYAAFGAGGVSDGTKGDIVVSAGATVYTVGAKAITLAKMADLAANSIMGNNTGLAATPIALTAAQVKTLLAVGVADITDASADGRSLISAANYAGMVTLLSAAGIGINNTFTKAQRVTPSVLVDAVTIAVDASLSNTFTVTLAGNRTLGNPTNLVDGQNINVFVKQDAVGGRTLAYASKWKFPSGLAPTLTATANAVDCISGIYDATSDTIRCGSATLDIR